MSTIHLHQITTATPEQFLAALIDFGPGRSTIFGRSADDHLTVHDRGPTEADVTEGSGGVWERLHYDWSDPHRVVLTITDSNVWGGASGHTYTFTRRPNATTAIDAVVVEGVVDTQTHAGIDPGVTNRRRVRSSPIPERRHGRATSNTCERHTMTPPIVLVHGLWLTPRSCEHWKARFEERGHEVLAPACPAWRVRSRPFAVQPSRSASRPS